MVADQGANRSKSFIKRGPVYSQMTHGRICIAKKMLKVGANIHAVDKFGHRPVDLAVDSGKI